MVLMVDIEFIKELKGKAKYGTFKRGIKTENYGKNRFTKLDGTITNKAGYECNGYVISYVTNKDVVKFETLILKDWVEDFERNSGFSIEEIVESINKLGFNINLSENENYYIFEHELTKETPKKAYYSFCMIRHLYYYENILNDYLVNERILNPKNEEEAICVLSSKTSGNVNTFMPGFYLGGLIDYRFNNGYFPDIWFFNDINLRIIEKFLEIKDRDKVGRLFENLYDLRFLDEYALVTSFKYLNYERDSYKEYKNYMVNMNINTNMNLTFKIKNKSYTLPRSNYKTEINKICAELQDSFLEKVKE